MTTCLVGWSQTQHFYTADKLSSNQITAITQDADGYIWIGTEYGLNKYDGYSFTNYLYDKNNTTSIQSNNVVTLFVDRQGFLWVGTGMGLSRYIAEEDAFQRIPLPGVAAARVSDIIQPADDHLLIGTAGYGLYRLDLKTCKAEQMERGGTGVDDYFSRIKIDQEGTFWKAGSGPIINYRKKDDKKTVYSYESPFGTVTSIVDYENGLLMVCRRGLIYYRNGEFLTDFIDTSVLGEENVLLRSALCDKEGNLFIGTLGKGLWWIPRGTHQLQQYNYSSAVFDLNTSNVWALFEDNQDNLWVGCLKRGLLLLPQRAPQFSTWKFSSQNVSIGGSVTSFCQGDNGITWPL